MTPIEYLRQHPKAGPLVLMRKFKITFSKAMETREEYDNEKDSEPLSVPAVFPHIHMQ